MQLQNVCMNYANKAMQIKQSQIETKFFRCIVMCFFQRIDGNIRKASQYSTIVDGVRSR